MYPHELSAACSSELRSAASGHRSAICSWTAAGALDAMTQDELDIELLRIWKAQKSRAVRDHSIQAVFLSDVVFVMSAQPGQLLETIIIDLPRPTVEMMSATKFSEYTLKIRGLLSTGSGGHDSGGSTMKSSRLWAMMPSVGGYGRTSLGR
jgi:NitT/TauT family transport system ATP-binding protein